MKLTLNIKKKIVLVASIGLIYFFIVSLTGFGIPCIFHLITGLQCPGCGITTMIVDIFSFDFKGAFIANQFIFITWPFIAFEIFYLSYNKGKNKINNIVLVIYLACLISFGLIRNL